MLRLLAIGTAAIVSVESGGKAASHQHTEEFVSIEHARGLTLEHATGQAAWPLQPGDAALIQQALQLLPAGQWTFEDEDSESNPDGPGQATWVWGYLRKVHEPVARDALMLHMLHRHGLAPLLASHNEDDFRAFLRDFEPEEADKADLARDDATRATKTRVLAELKFGPVADLIAVLSQISLQGLRNLHAYDHSGNWRCLGHGSTTAHAGGAATQASTDRVLFNWMRPDSTHNWMRAREDWRVQHKVQMEVTAMFDEVQRLAWGGNTKNDGFLTLGGDYVPDYGVTEWGAIAPIDEWIQTTEGLRFELKMDGRNCHAMGTIIWQEVQTASTFDVPLMDVEGEGGELQCARLLSLFNSGPDGRRQVAETVSQLVKIWVDTAVLQHRDLIKARRSVFFADEEFELFSATDRLNILGDPLRRPSECPRSHVVRGAQHRPF